MKTDYSRMLTNRAAAERVETEPSAQAAMGGTDVKKARVVHAGRSMVLAVAAIGVMSMAVAVNTQSALAQTAADAALTMANMLDGAGGGVSNSDLMLALEDAAAAGQPMALYRLGMMYENGEGVKKDAVRAFGYFSRIANDNADTAPKGLEADIVAQSFVKVGEYYRDGLPDAGIKADADRSHALMMHAASYFGDADAQYRVGQFYMAEDELGVNPLQSARWLSLAARKGHVPAQAQLGNILFNGEGIEPQPAEGLMWLTLAHDNSLGTPDAPWISEMLTGAMSVATPEARQQAIKMAEHYGPRFKTN